MGIFSPLDNDGKQEVFAKAIVERELGPETNVVCSRDGKSYFFVRSATTAVIDYFVSGSSGPPGARKRLYPECRHSQLCATHHQRIQTRHAFSRSPLSFVSYAKRRYLDLRGYRCQATYSNVRFRTYELYARCSVSCRFG